MVPRVALVTWEARLKDSPNPEIFVAVPDERGRYMRTHVCVALVECTYCHAGVGEPCRSLTKRYSAGTHVDRRALYTHRRKNGQLDIKPEHFDVERFAEPDIPLEEPQPCPPIP